MGMIGQVFALLFGGGRNVVRDTVEVFRENAEAGAARDAGRQGDALAQFAAEFARRDRGWFDRLMDGVNRVPRPALALGTLALFGAAMVDPLWFAARMQGVALVPEPLWWLLGVIVSFYFGARHQHKTQDFHRSLAATMAQAPQLRANMAGLARPTATTPGVGDSAPDANVTLESVRPQENPALEDWRRDRRRGQHRDQHREGR